MARVVVTMRHPLSGETQRASQAAFESTWRDEGWVEVSSEEFVPEEVDKPVEKMTVAELKSHADKNQIDLGEATKKDDILAVIQAHLDAPPAEDPPANPDE